MTDFYGINSAKAVNYNSFNTQTTSNTNNDNEASIFGNPAQQLDAKELEKKQKAEQKYADEIKKYNIDTTNLTADGIKEAIKVAKEMVAKTPDGVIQGGKQGSSAGDCWLLAEMNSMATTTWGKEAFKNGITKDEKGNYVVHFKGVGKDYTITEEELKKARRRGDLSSGDADPILYEIATERYFKENDINNKSIKGNNLSGEDSLQYLLTGVKGKETKNTDTINAVLKEMGKNPDKIAATYMYYDQSQGSDGVHHAMSIQSVKLNDNGDVESVTVLDSYKPDSPQTIKYKRFIAEVKDFGYVTPPKENA